MVFSQSGFPLRQRLPGQAEHQIDIHVREPGLAQDVKRSFRLGGVVFPAQQLEQFVIPGLDAQADPVHSQAAEQSRLCEAKRCPDLLPPSIRATPTRSSRSRKPPRRYSSCAVVSAVGVPPPMKIVSGATGQRAVAHPVHGEAPRKSAAFASCRRAPCKKRSKGKSARKTECGRKGAGWLPYVGRWTLDVERWTFPSSLINSVSTAQYLADSNLSSGFFLAPSRRPLRRARQPLPDRAIVYSAHDPAAIKDYRTDPAVVRAMVNRLVLAVTGQPDLARAWGSLVSPDDKIGIKISAAGGELFTTHRDVVNAIVDGLVAAGHRRGNIIVWDRSLGGIKDAGYRPGRGGISDEVHRAP